MSERNWLADLPPDPPPIGEEILLALPRRGDHGGPDELRVQIRSYEGHVFLDIRIWQSSRTGWQPGKGVTVKVREVAQVARALAIAARKLEGRT
jgi:hypothetical protein